MCVQEPDTLDAALKIAQRVERDMGGMNDRRSTLNVVEVTTPQEQNSRQVRFSQDRGRSPSPYQDGSTEQRRQEYLPLGRRDYDRGNRSPSPYQNESIERRYREYVPFSRQNDERRNRSPSLYRRNSPYRGNSPDVKGQNREGSYPRRQSPRPGSTIEVNRPSREQQRNYTDSRLPRYPSPRYNYPPRWPADMQMSYPYTPPMPYGYPGSHFYAPPPPPQFYYNQSCLVILEPTREDSNSIPARQLDALTSEPKNEHPITVKFLSAGDLMKNPQDEE